MLQDAYFAQKMAQEFEVGSYNITEAPQLFLRPRNLFRAVRTSLDFDSTRFGNTLGLRFRVEGATSGKAARTSAHARTQVAGAGATGED